jgi:hypothetical protein
MFQKVNFKMVVLTILFVIPLMLGTTSDLFAGGGNVEDPVGELDAHLQGPAIVGNANLTLLTEFVPPNEYVPTDINIQIIGKCKAQDVNINVDITAASAGVDDVSDFTGATKKAIESIIVAGAGPAGCYDGAGGQDIIAVNAKDPVHGTDAYGNPTINTDAVVLQVVYP